MTFQELAKYIEQIEQTKSRLTITQVLSDLYKKLTPDEIEKTCYLLQGRVAPLYEKTEFVMAEKMVIKSIVSAFNCERKLFETEYEKIGDLGQAVEQFRREEQLFNSKKDLSIVEVFTDLTSLADASGEGSQTVKINILANLIRQLDPLSSRYIVRIPVGVMRLGFSDMTVLDAFSWMIGGDKSLRKSIEQAYHVRPDLGFIGKTLKEKGVKGIQNIKPKVFTPILMMRAERLSSAKEIIGKIGVCAIQQKFDGFRLQVHYKNSEVKLYSRNLEEVTQMYPDIVQAVKKELNVNEIIFEGEAIGFDPQTGRFLPFQETVQRKRKYDIENKAKEVPLKLFAFELLVCNGIDYIQIPYRERRKILEKSIPQRKKNECTIVVAPEKILDKDTTIENEFESAIAKGLEGIIAKKLDGIYQAGARGWNWIKFKRSYSSKIEDTIDCLVMGYDYGKGKRTSFGIGAFLVGVYDDSKNIFLTIAKIGTGLTDEEWMDLKLKIKNLELKIKEIPKNYNVDKMMNCDVWLSPKIVVEIRADEISRSPVHTAEFALRFPRLERFREDKRPEDITTLIELETMFKEQSKKTF